VAVAAGIATRWDIGDAGKDRRPVGTRYDGLGTWRDAGWRMKRTSPKLAAVDRRDLEMDYCCCRIRRCSERCRDGTEEGRLRRKRKIDC